MTLRIVVSYKHLGARCTMDADLNEEVQAFWSAWQAFKEIRKSAFLKAHSGQGREDSSCTLASPSQEIILMFHGSDIIATHLHQREKTLLLIIVGFATMDLATIPDREPGFLQYQLPYFECHGRDNDCPIFNTCKERPWVLQ